MLRACDLSREQLECIVDQIQRLLFFTEDEENNLVFDPEKDIQSGADFINNVGEALRLVEPDLIPNEITPVDPPCENLADSQ